MNKTRREELFKKEVERLNDMGNNIVRFMKESGLTLEEIAYISSFISAQYMQEILKAYKHENPNYEQNTFFEKCDTMNDAIRMKAMEMEFSNIEFDYMVSHMNLMSSHLSLQTIMFDDTIFDKDYLSNYIKNITSYHHLFAFLLEMKEEKENEQQE